ncbi:MAG: TIM barrel protein [Bryobacteraceae bacterium]
MMNEKVLLKRRELLLAPLAAVALRARSRSLKNPFFALCMDTHDEKKRNLAEQAAMLKDLGYDGAGHLWLDGLKERVETLDRAGLRLFQVYLRLNIGPNPKQVYDPRLKDSLPLLKGRETTLAFLVDGAAPSDESFDARAVELIREVAGMAEPYGLRVVLYPHWKNWLEKVEDCVRLSRKIDRGNVGIMFNLCHWMKVGDEEQLKPLLKAAMPRLMAVSISGSDRVAEIKSGKGNWIQPLDSGTFDIRGFLNTLTGMGYGGPIGLQCYGIRGDARIHLERSMAAWRKLKAD